MQQQQVDGAADHQLKHVYKTLEVPSHAMGMIIGKQGAYIKMLKALKGITSVSLAQQAGNLNCQILHMRGEEQAVEGAMREAAGRIRIADEMLSKRTRQKHSWSETPDRPGSHV